MSRSGGGGGHGRGPNRRPNLEHMLHPSSRLPSLREMEEAESSSRAYYSTPTLPSLAPEQPELSPQDSPESRTKTLALGAAAAVESNAHPQKPARGSVSVASMSHAELALFSHSTAAVAAAAAAQDNEEAGRGQQQQQQQHQKQHQHATGPAWQQRLGELVLEAGADGVPEEMLRPSSAAAVREADLQPVLDEVLVRMLEEDRERMASLEDDLALLVEMFEDVEDLVEAAAPMLDEIEESVEVTRHNTLAAAVALAEAARRQADSWPLMWALYTLGPGLFPGLLARFIRIRQINRDLKQLQDAVRWIPDDCAPVCMNCGAAFNFFLRRHHCRICGGVFCARCSRKRVPLLYLGLRGVVRSRVCDFCQATPKLALMPGGAG